MKRTVQFKDNDNSYVCIENEKAIFEISKEDLQFDIKAFYQAFYSDDKDYSDIIIENCIPEDSNARRVYECIEKLMTKIKDKLLEMPEKEGNILDKKTVI